MFMQEGLTEELLFVEIKMRVPHHPDLASCGCGLKIQNFGKAIRAKQAAVRATSIGKKNRYEVDGLDFIAR